MQGHAACLNAAMLAAAAGTGCTDPAYPYSALLAECNALAYAPFGVSTICLQTGTVIRRVSSHNDTVITKS